MLKKNYIYFLLLVIFPSLCFSKIELTKKEKDFLSKKKEIILGTDKNWEPYTIIDENGILSGYDVSVLKLINEVSGANFVIKRGTWSNLIKEVKEKKIAGLSTGIKSKKRSSFMNFSKPYLKLEKIIFTNSQKEKIENLNDLEGKILAIDKNNLADLVFIKSLPKVKILKTNDANEAINAVTTQRADAMIGNAAMLYILNKKGNPFLKPSIILPQKDNLELVFSLRKNFPEAVSIINKSLNAIGEQKLLELKKYWFYTQSLDKENIFNNSQIHLTKKEKEYLNKKQIINMCIDPNWMPFEKLENGIYMGLSSDFFHYFEKSLNNEFKIIKTKNWTQSIKFAKERKCDILSLAMKTKKRQEYMNFTSSYLSIPMVLATKNNLTFIDDLTTLKNKKIAIESNYAFIDILKKNYPNLELVYTKNLNESLKKVVKDQVFGAVGSIAAISYEVQNNFMSELKIAAKFNERLNLSIAVRNDDFLLLSILEKSIQSISKEFKQKILNKYLAIKYENKIDYTLAIEIGLISIFIVIIFIYWNRKLSIAKMKLELAQKDIEKKNKELERISNTDKLTGIYNRLKLDSVLQEKLTYFKRYNKHFGAILIDIDFFKNINDTFGHVNGDKFLIEFSKLLNDNIRECDYLGRWGGEEFLIISSDITKDGITILAEKLKEKIQTNNFSKVGNQTASFGVTINSNSDTIESMLSRADEALYKSKKEGRNKVSFKFKED